MGSEAWIVPETVSRKAAEKQHADFPQLYRELRFARESYEGSGGYAPYLDDVTVADTQPDDMRLGTLSVDTSRRTYLMRHPREKEKFTRRVMMAYLTNVIRLAINMLVGFIAKQQPVYDDWPDGPKKWMSRVNAAGDDWEKFKEAEIFPQLGYYGFLPVVFYRAKTDSVTAAQQIAAGGQLTAEVICPENIIDWQWAADGSYVWLKFRSLVDRTEPLDETSTQVTRYTWYTQEGWWYVEDDGTSAQLPVMGSGRWIDGLPVVVWRLRGGGLARDANGAQRELYNVNSLVQEQEREATFAMLRAPGQRGEKDRIKAVGSNVWWFHPESRHPPEWMAPPPHVLDHFMVKRATLVEEIFEAMGLTFDKGGGQTGMAFQFKMAKIVRLLLGVANAFSRGDTASMERVSKELGDTPKDTVRVEYPTDFDARDVAKDLEALVVVLERVHSATARAEAEYRMVTTAMPGLDEKVRTAIRRETDEGIEEDDLDEENRGDFGEKPPEQEPDAEEENAEDVQADGGAR